MQVTIRYVYMNMEELSGNYLNYIRFEPYDKVLKIVVVHGVRHTLRLLGPQQSQQKEA